MTLAHLDETGAPCAQHPAVPLDEVLTQALIASRLSGFHHDLASKLQGLMMALDEMVELSEGGEPALKEAGDSASQALREILALLHSNRALTKPALKVQIAAGDLCGRALERARATLSQPVPEVALEVSVPRTLQALALAFDVAGGPGRNREIEARTSLDSTHLVLSLALPAELGAPAGQVLGLAAHGLTLDGGDLRCQLDGARMVVRLPLAE